MCLRVVIFLFCGCVCQVGWGACTSLAQAQSGPSAQDANQILGRLQKRLAQSGDYTANFQQIYHDSLRQKTREERGRLEVKKAGPLRFVYEGALPKQFVFDGNTAFFSEPQSGQVTVFPSFDKTVAAQSMRILWGQALMGDLFTPTACEAPCPSAPEGGQVIALKPRVPIPTVQRIALVVLREDVVRACVFDSLGNTTEYIFSAIEHNAQLPDASFRFKIPKGASVLYAPSGEPQKSLKKGSHQPDLRAREPQAQF